jgi:hypothetical protein
MTTHGYSGTPLVKKLGIKPGFRVAVAKPPAHYWDLLGPLPSDVRWIKRVTSKPVDFVHIFSRRAADLEAALGMYRSNISDSGMIWVSWPKKSSGVATEIGEADVRRAGLAHGLVDVKICAVDETWSGLKFVVRVKDRRS